MRTALLAPHRRRFRPTVLIEALDRRLLLNAGQLDPDFGSGGVATPPTFITGANSIATAVAFDPAGAIVIAGQTRTAAVLARFGPGGSLDPSFGIDGKVAETGVGDPSAVVVQPDRKVITAGVNGASLRLVRRNANGSLDPTFSEDGIALVEDLDVGLVRDLHVSADGAVLLTGGSNNTWVVRLRADGTPDRMFGGDGAVTPDGDVNAFPPGVTPLAIDTDEAGRVIVAGVASRGLPGEHAILLRLNPDGSADASFGLGGIWEGPPDGADAYDVSALADGGVVVAGTDAEGYFLRRFNPDGTPDRAFAPAGRIGIPDDTSTSYGSHPMALTESGGLFVEAVVRADDAAADVVVRKFLPDGRPDTSFGSAGEVRRAAGDGTVETAGVAVDPAGNVVAAVAVDRYVLTYVERDLTAFHYSANGAPLPPPDGRLTARFQLPAEVHVNAIAEAPDGRFFAAASVAEGGGFALGRFNRDGSLDRTFADEGWSRLHPAIGRPAVMTVLSDGKLLIGGYVPDNSALDWPLMRLMPDGTFDPTFGAGGLVTVDIPGGSSTSVRDLAVQPDGKVVAVGDVSFPDRVGEIAAVRVNADGSLDPTFGGDGIVTTYVGGIEGHATSVAAQGDGGVLVGGFVRHASYNGPDEWALVRYRPDGSLDPAFGSKSPGISVLLPTSDGGAVTDLLPLSGGAFMAAGRVDYTRPGSMLVTSDFALARFGADGELDTSFHGDPFATAGFPTSGDTARAVPRRLERQADGKFVLAGFAEGAYGHNPGPAAARFNRDGSLDTSFGATGRVRFGTQQLGHLGEPGETLLTRAGEVLFDLSHSSEPNLRFARVTGDAPAAATVAARHVFYDNSAFDGYDTDPALDDNAVATDKVPLLPGDRPTFANVTSYSRGINGIMIDIAGLPGRGEQIVASNFDIRVLRSTTWELDLATYVRPVRRGAGVGGSDRLTILFVDRAIRNTWVRVTVLATPATGLSAPDVFYFGHLYGETGDNAALTVNAADLARVRGAQLTPAGITSPLDFNRDGRVNALDLAIARSNQLRSLAQPPGVAPPSTPALFAAQPLDVSSAQSELLAEERQDDTVAPAGT